MRSVVLVAAGVLLGCGATPSVVSVEGESTTGSLATGTLEGSGSGESSTVGSSSGSIEPLCEPDLTDAPELVQARNAEGIIFHAAAGSSGIYLAGLVSTDSGGGDVEVSRIDATGAELWTARWGSALGWDDTPSALLPVEEGVFVAGIAGLYPSQEYSSTGTSFVRGYSPGGLVRWTWEDSSASSSGVSDRQDGPAVSVGSETIAVVAPMLEQQNRVGLRFVSLDRSTGAERSRVELDAVSAEPGAARVDEEGITWVVATTAEGSVMLRWDGVGQPSIEASAGDSLFRRAFFYTDGSFLALSSAPGGGGKLLQLRRYSQQLQLELEGFVAVSDFSNAVISDVAITAGCDDNLLISAGWSDGSPVIAVDANLEELWTMRGLGSVALAGEDVIFAGYDDELETPAIWQLRFP